jgi:heme exporter protein B
MRATRAILAKDLRIELRALESVPAMALFSLTTFVIFRFGLDRTELSGSLAAGVVLVTLLFAGLLAVNRLFAAEQREGGFDALRLSPADASAMFVAKVCALFVYLLALEVVALPAFALFFLDEWSGLPALLGVACLLNLALGTTGALIAAMTAGARAREVLAPLVLLPLLVPPMIAAANLAAPILEVGGPEFTDAGQWLAVIALYDSIFGLIGWAVYDFLLED